MAEKIKKYFLEALKAFLKNESVTWGKEDNLDFAFWQQLFEISMNQNVLPMVVHVVYQCEAFLKLPDNFRNEVKHNAVRLIAYEAITTQNFLELYEQFVKQGIKPQVVKGLICRNMYAHPEYRLSSDEDLFVTKKDAEASHRILMENGFETDWDGNVNQTIPDEVTYTHLDKGMRLEMHYALFAKDSSAYGELNTFFADSQNRKIAITINGVDVYTMNHTDHFLYLICHAFKHFLHSGFGIRQVCDITMFANIYGKYIDWDYVWKKTTSVHANIFTGALLTIGSHYLVLDEKKACVTKVWKECNVDSTDLINDLLDGGVFGDSSMSRKHSSTLTLNAVTAKKKHRKSQPSMLRTIFPERSYLVGRYPYLKRHKILLPIAWISRIMMYHKEIKSSWNDENAKKSMQIGSQRIELLKKYKVI